MARYATQSPSTLVVDFAQDAPPAPSAKLGRSNILSRFKRHRWLEVGTQPEGFYYTLKDGFINRIPRKPAHCQTEQDQSNIAVYNALASRIREKCTQRQLDSSFGIGLIFERAPGRQPGVMRQQIAEGDLASVHSACRHRFPFSQVQRGNADGFAPIERVFIWLNGTHTAEFGQHV